jgi:hypothetical protein
MKVKIFKNAFIRTLASNVEENFGFYRSGNFVWATEADNGENFYELDAPWMDESALLALNGISDGQLDEVADARDSKALYNALKSMPPEVARDARVWTTLCHTHCLEYIRKRNHKFLFSIDKEEATRVIKSRFFIENASRSYERTNGLARLWWYGYLVQQTGLDFEKAIDTQLTYTDFRASTVERPLVFSHKEIRSALLDVAIKHRESGDDFFKNRTVFREVVKDLNIRATRIFFPAMPHEVLTNFVEQRLSKNGVNGDSLN